MLIETFEDHETRSAALSLSKKNNVVLLTHNIAWVRFMSILYGLWLNRYFHMHTHTHTHACPFYGSLDIVWDNPVSRYQKKHSPTHPCRGRQSSLICFIHLLWSIASSLFSLRAWQSFSTISFQVFFGTSWPDTLYFCSTCPYHHNLFCCSIKIMSSNPGLSTVTFTLSINK